MLILIKITSDALAASGLIAQLGKEIDMQIKPTEYGFEWGPLKIERGFSDDAKGWATLILSTKKYPHGIQIYVTKTGKVRVYSAKGEWLPKKEASGDKRSEA